LVGLHELPLLSKLPLPSRNCGEGGLLFELSRDQPETRRSQSGQMITCSVPLDLSLVNQNDAGNPTMNISQKPSDYCGLSDLISIEFQQNHLSMSSSVFAKPRFQLNQFTGTFVASEMQISRIVFRCLIWRD
jgi:hypothetical protein